MNRLSVVFAVCTALLQSAACLAAESIVVECEQFADMGGWSIDSQFIDEMGSSYLLAHGAGAPVADAVTRIAISAAGEYSVFVRTKNWTAPWSDSPAGVFKVLVDGRELPAELGTEGGGKWCWQKAGAVNLATGEHELTLRDCTGFDGRCDAICLTRDRLPPEAVRWPAAALPDEVVRADLVVCGAGVAGVCAAISAARLGLKVALVGDRPVLGGANSSEVRVHLGGHLHLGAYPRLGDVVEEIGPAKGGNARSAANYEDDRKLAAVRAEDNITLFLNTRIVAAETANGAITSVTGRGTVDGRRTRFEAPLFADCTGDGAAGALAGADFRIGREGRDETGEDRAPAHADGMTMGASIQWNARNEPNAAFPVRPWMLKFSEESCCYLKHGDWDWETGMNRDQLGNFEYVRDYGMLAVYSNWAFIKNAGRRKAEWKDLALNWVAFVAGKRETRRLMGDHVLAQQDIFENRPMPDGTCWATWSVDLHYPMPENARHFPDDPFRSICRCSLHSGYAIPYRCLYSRNIDNLFMAGRNISVTHVALGAVRVMRTTGMMGEVVGMAASVCKKHECRPRAVYERHLDELKSLMSRGVGKGVSQPQQNYNLGAMLSPVSPSSGVSADADKSACNTAVGGTEGDLGVKIDCRDPDGWRFDVAETSPETGVEVVRIALKRDVEAPPPKFSVKWFLSQKDIHHVWSSDSTHYGIPWSEPFCAELTSWMPLYAFLDANDRSRMTVACSESCRKTEFRAQISEKRMGFQCSFSFFSVPEAPMKEYAVEIRLDSRDIFYGDAIGDASEWMCRASGVRPMEAPETAFDPLYSTWYTFHQDVSGALVEEECRLAAKLGMRTLITDDGWQIDQPIGKRTEVGYMFCGDWAAGRNFPDMAAHVRRVHALGFKYMLWYSVPFIGEKSANFARFKGKFLPAENSCDGGWVLDPRFPDVREFLVNTYEKAVREWDLDGLKLDFIGRFTLKGADPAVLENYAGRDIRCIPLAVERLLTDVMARLKAIKPDILIEFRQPYIGPCIRKFGNMIRATDCPLSMVENRTRIARLRLTSGNTAVHSDMLEWRSDETPESAARCIINSLFGVVQYSVRLKTLPESHRRMLAHWIRFSQDHRQALLHGKFRAHYPAADYPLLEGESEEERIFCVYQPNLAVDVGKPDRRVIVVNGAFTDSVILDLPFAPPKAEAFDTFGNNVPLQTLKTGINRITLPPSGYVVIEWCKEGA